MKWIKFSPLFLVALLGCADPIEFPKSDTPLISVDAKLSIEEGESLVQIHEYKGETKERIVDFQISIIDSKGDILPLTYSQDKGGYVFPNSGKVNAHEYYFMKAQHPDGYTITSSLDMVSTSVDFELVMSDTIFFDKNPFSEGDIVRTLGVAAKVKLKPERDEYYARIFYKNTYEDFFSGEIEDRTEPDFLYLFSCEKKNCDKTITETVRVERSVYWLFVRDTQTCKEVFQSGNCPSVPNCCRSFTEYETQMTVTLETISKETYQFWKEIERLRNNDGLVFDVLPFPFEGNISCDNCPMEVIGTFRVTSERSKSRRAIL